jgi:hypothetical protein
MVALFFYLFRFVFISFYFILVSFYKTHQVLLGLPQGVGGLACYFISFIFYFYKGYSNIKYDIVSNFVYTYT